MAGRVAIDRFSLIGLGPAGHDAPDRLRAAIDGVGAGRLAAALRRTLPDANDSDPRVIRIRKLEISLDGARTGEPDRIADRIATGIAAAIRRAADRAPPDNVQVFASAGARLAAFVVQLAAGRAWLCWWFGDFEGLRALPTSAAIRTALLRDAAQGLEALRACDPADWARVAGSLGDGDAGMVFDGLTDALALGGDDDWTLVFALPPPPGGLGTAQERLCLLADLSSAIAEAPTRSAAAAIRMRTLLSRVDGTAAAPAITSRSVARVRHLLPDARIKDIAALVSLSEEPLVRIGARVRAGRAAADVAQAYTRFGGVLLLWPHLPEVAPEALPEGPGDRIGLAALLALSSLFGEIGGARAADDPVLRRAFKIDPRATDDALADWLSRLGRHALPPGPPIAHSRARVPAALRRHRDRSAMIVRFGLSAVSDFARRLPGFGAASLPFLRENLLDIGATVTIEKDRVQAVLDRPKLDVLLGISGLADREVALPDGRALVLERAR